MYQKRILPYFVIPSTYLPQASSPLECSRQTDIQTDRQIDRQTDNILHLLLPKCFFFTEHAGPYKFKG